MTHFQGHRSFFVNADAEPRIKHRQFISKARSDYIKVRLIDRLKTFVYPENCKDYGSFDISYKKHKTSLKPILVQWKFRLAIILFFNQAEHNNDYRLKDQQEVKISVS